MYQTLVKKYGDPEIISYVALVGENLPDNCLRINAQSAGVNFADLLLAQGKYQVRPKLPFAPGLEVSGTVIEIGNKVTEFKVGDRVM